MLQTLYTYDHPSKAGSLEQLGMVYLAEGRYNQALEYQKAVLEMVPKFRTLDDHNVAICLTKLGQTHELVAQYEQALSTYGSALEILRSPFPDGHPDFAIALSNMAA